jgi:NAD+ kinase
MRIAVVGKDRKSNQAIEMKLRKMGHLADHKRPEVVVCNGGDGTLLYNERRFPGVPKLMLRGKHACRRCKFSNEQILRKLCRKEYMIKEYGKLETMIAGRKLIAANDIVVRNLHPSRALRFTVHVDGKKEDGTIIGDGVVVSTSFGSTGYYQSIARRSFRKGIGLAFSNTVARQKHRVLGERANIRIRAVREDALLSCDNMAKLFRLKSGESVTVRASRKKTRVIIF